jgi:hypothetical protein
MRKIEVLAAHEHKRFVEERRNARAAENASRYAESFRELPDDIADLDRDAVRAIPTILSPGRSAGDPHIHRRSPLDICSQTLGPTAARELCCGRCNGKLRQVVLAACIVLRSGVGDAQDLSEPFE